MWTCESGCYIFSMIPYGRQSVGEEEFELVSDVLHSDWLTTGPMVARFEADLKSALGGPSVATVSSGTAALHAAYHAAGVNTGSQVVTSPLTFIATAATAVNLGAKVLFADIREDTLNIDAEQVASLVSDRTTAVCAVDYAGRPADLSALLRICRAHDVYLIEDAAHAIGSKYRGVPVGALADITTFSFHPVKTLTTCEGGAVSSRHEALISKVKEFRNHGLTRDPRLLRSADEGEWHQEVRSFGLNYRLSDLHAAVGVGQLGRLEHFVEARRRLVNNYREGLSDVAGLRLPAQEIDTESAWHLFVIRVLNNRRAELWRALRLNGITPQVHYYPLHLQPVFQDLGYKKGQFPLAESAYAQVVSLPLYVGLTEVEQERVVEVVRSTLA
jgi:dTDP-4-amino-4,6-dideoxygalactose transaminase